MKIVLRSVLAASTLLLSMQATAQITFYDKQGFRGRAVTSDRAVADFGRTNFNDAASSIVIDRGFWEVCEDSRYRGNCAVLGPGSYNRLGDIGMGNKISSVRPVNNARRQPNYVAPPLSEPDYAYRRRPQERIYQAPVTSVRAVLNQGNQRCWMERERYDQRRDRNDKNVQGAVVGAIIGGILGHQIGDGRGRDAATIGGAVAGAAIGAQSGRNDSNRGYERGVQRCDNNFRGAHQYWDVSYEYRGVEHWVRMTDPPGRTIAVNRRGEPRE